MTLTIDLSAILAHSTVSISSTASVTGVCNSLLSCPNRRGEGIAVVCTIATLTAVAISPSPDRTIRLQGNRVSGLSRNHWHRHVSHSPLLIICNLVSSISTGQTPDRDIQHQQITLIAIHIGDGGSGGT